MDISNKYIHYGMPIEGKREWVETIQYIQWFDE
jgi:hypothetical protein